MFKIKVVGNPWFLFGGWRGERFLASSDTQHEPWHPLVCKHVPLTSVSVTTWTSTLNLPACSLMQVAFPPVCIQMSLPFQEYQLEDWWLILMELFFQASHLLDGHELSKDTVCSTKYLFQWSFFLVLISSSISGKVCLACRAPNLAGAVSHCPLFYPGL